MARGLYDGRLPAQLAHGLDAFAQLAEQGDKHDIVALRENFGGEGALFVRGEDGEVRDEGVDVAEDGVGQLRAAGVVVGCC